MGAVHLVIECVGCNRMILLPAEWQISDYLCLPCRRRPPVDLLPPQLDASPEAAGG